MTEKSNRINLFYDSGHPFPVDAIQAFDIHRRHDRGGIAVILVDNIFNILNLGFVCFHEQGIFALALHRPFPDIARFYRPHVDASGDFLFHEEFGELPRLFHIPAGGVDKDHILKLLFIGLWFLIQLYSYEG